MLKNNSLPLSEKLKENTKTNHQWLEKKIVVQIRQISTAEDYARLLSMFYGFFGGLEILADTHSCITFLPDYLLRRKSKALADDLLALNAALPTVANENELPGIKNELQTAGALYVMEGSTLGGKFIAKMIREKLNFSDLNAFSFFDGYGEQTEKKWQIFKEAIDALPPGDDNENIVIRSANDTFVQFSKWVDKYSNLQLPL